MITKKMETILIKASRSLQRELDADDLDDYNFEALPEADAKRMRRIIKRMEEIAYDSHDEREDEELADAASAGAVAPAATILEPVSELQARAEKLYPGMTKRRR